MPITVAVNNSAVVHGMSPYNWDTTNSPTSILSINEGAYIKLGFTGTSIGATWDPSAMAALSYSGANYPMLKWAIFNYPSMTIAQNWQSKLMLYSDAKPFTLASSLPTGNYVLWFFLQQLDGSNATIRWTSGPMALVLNSFTIDTAATVFNAPLRTGGYMCSFGDSITAAYGTGNFSGDTINGDATLGYAAWIANQLNMEWGNCAFPGQGWANNWSVEGVPNFYLTSTTGTWQSLNSSTSRVFSPVPDLLTLNMGQNDTGVDSVTATMVQNWITAMRAALVSQDAVKGAACLIVVIVPFSYTGSGYTFGYVSTGVGNYQAAHPGDTRVAYADLGSGGASIVYNNTYSPPGPHPNADGYRLLAWSLYPLIQPWGQVATVAPSGSVVSTTLTVP